MAGNTVLVTGGIGEDRLVCSMLKVSAGVIPRNRCITDGNVALRGGIVGGIELRSPAVGASVNVVYRSSKARLWLGCPVLASRYVHWWLTRRLSFLWAFFLRAARSPLTVAVVVVVILWQGPPIYKRVTGHTVSWEAVAVLLALAGLVTLMVRSRRRTVFQDFPDCTTAGASHVVPGLGAYLANEVDRLGALYRTVQREGQEAKSPGRPGKPIEPTIELDDTAEFLKDAVSPDAKLSFGPVSIPLGSILGLVARLMKGPQITGSLHREGDQLILLAHYEGAHPKSWRVEGERGSADCDDKGRWNLYHLVEEMAVRMLGDLTLGGAVKFRAVSAFTNAMRTSLEDGGLERPSLLRQLEVRNHLLDAIAEDKSFDLAWYNLGVTLLALGDQEMARSVFTRARHDNPSRWQATYALAGLPGDFTARLCLCDQLLSVRPGSGPEAQAYDLEGNLFAEQAAKLSKKPDAREKADARELRKLAVARRRLAARQAWRALRQAEWSARNDQESVQLEGRQRLTATCLTNLAHSYRDDILEQAEAGPKRRLRRAARQAELLLKEAGKLARLDPQAHLELGALNDQLVNWKRAAKEYEKVLRVVIDDPNAWVSFAKAWAEAAGNTPAKVGDTTAKSAARTSGKVPTRQRFASQGAQALLTLAPLVTVNQLTEVATAIDGFDFELADQLRCLTRLRHLIGDAILAVREREPEAQSQLEELTKEVKSQPGGAWEYYLCAIARCCQEPPSTATTQTAKAVVDELLQATEKLDKECAPAVRQKNIHYAVAKVLAGRGEVLYALDNAEKATQDDPFNPWAWQLLGDLHRRRAEFDEAAVCYLAGLRWVTERIHLVALTVSLAACRLDRLENEFAAHPADKGLLDARDLLAQVLPALESPDFPHRTKVHYWLGRIALALDDCEQAIADFAAASQPSGPDKQLTAPSKQSTKKQLSCNDVSTLALAKALMKASRLDEARVTFESLDDDTVLFDSNGGSLTATVNMGLDTSPTLAEVLVDDSVDATIMEFIHAAENMGLDRSPTLAEVLVEAKLGSAATHVRGADSAQAKRLIELARPCLRGLPEEAQIRFTGQVEALLGRVEAMAGHNELAIEHLRRSISCVNDSGTYLSLAEEYGWAARYCRTQARRREYRRLLEDCGRSIRTLGTDDNHAKRVDELVAQVDAIVAGLPAARVPDDHRPQRKPISASAPAPPTTAT